MRTRVAPAVVIMALLLMSWFPARGWTDELTLGKGAMCLDVKDRTPVGENNEFFSSINQVYCFTLIEGAEEPAEIAHVWRYRGEKVREIALPVKSVRWRTWSVKNIPPGFVGPWEVDIVDTARNQVIGTIQFSIK